MISDTKKRLTYERAMERLARAEVKPTRTPIKINFCWACGMRPVISPGYCDNCQPAERTLSIWTKTFLTSVMVILFFGGLLGGLVIFNLIFGVKP